MNTIECVVSSDILRDSVGHSETFTNQFHDLDVVFSLH